MLDLFMLFFKSLITGVAMAIPLGPICLLLIKKTLENGLKAGVAIAVGAACADALYSGVAGVAIASVAAFIAQHKFILRYIGKAVMAMVLVSEMRHQPAQGPSSSLNTRDTAALVGKIFLMTLANPVTILVISSVFISFEIHFNSSVEIAVAMTGVFLGSTLWCSTLAYFTLFAKRYLPKSFITGLQWFSLIILAGFVVIL